MDTTTTDQPEILFQDGSRETYECGPSACGYTGDTYCQNCGSEAGER